MAVAANLNPDLRVGGELVRVTGRDQALVKSRSSEGWHVVELDDEMGVYRCSCDGFMYRGRCRHVLTIARFVSGELQGVPVEG